MATSKKSTKSSIPAFARSFEGMAPRPAPAKDLLNELDVAIKNFFKTYARSKTPSERERIAEKIALAARVRGVLQEEAVYSH